MAEILFREALAAEGAVARAKACDLDLEKIVSKREGSFSRSWNAATDLRR